MGRNRKKKKEKKGLALAWYEDNIQSGMDKRKEKNRRRKSREMYIFASENLDD